MEPLAASNQHITEAIEKVHTPQPDKSLIAREIESVKKHKSENPGPYKLQLLSVEAPQPVWELHEKFPVYADQ